MDIFVDRRTRAEQSSVLDRLGKRSKKYGTKSVMGDDNISSDMRDFMQKGGVELLSDRARGKTSNQDLQASALEYKKTFSTEEKKKLNKLVGREASNAKEAGIHMGTPSEANKRLPSVTFLQSSAFKKRLRKASKKY
tara:strand:- start:1158 stop:1568 length:411 start_codon:yes stop_codon:yes gene_type:complete